MEYPNTEQNSDVIKEYSCHKEYHKTIEDITIDDLNSKAYTNTNENTSSKEDPQSKVYPNPKEDFIPKEDLNPKEDQPNYTNRWSLQEHPNKRTQVRNSPSLGSIPKHKRASKSSKDELSDLPETWDEECQKHLVDFAER